MKVLAKQNRELIMINAQNTQNENDAEKIILQVPEQYEDFNKKIVFITPDGNVWDIITNNEYLIKKVITKYKQVDFYIWLTKGDVDFRSRTKTLKFYDNVDASDEITDEEIGRVNTIVNLLEEEITKVENLESQIDGKLQEVDTAIENIHTAIQETENLDLDAEKVGQTTTVTLTKKDGTTKVVHVDDGVDLQFMWQGTSLGIKTAEQEEYTFVDLQGVQGQRGEQGEPFTIKKTYSSVVEMNADFNNMQLGDYVMIASTVEVEDNAKLYTRGENQWIFITDFSGATGIRGEVGLTPNVQIGTVTQGSSFNVTRTGTNENPVLNFTLVKGDKGDRGIQGIQGLTGNGIASITKTGTDGLVDTYTITYTNANTTTFTITNGEDGEVTETELNVLRQKLENQQKVIDQLPQVTGQGTSITLENTIEAQFTIFDEEGNSVQDGTPNPNYEQPIESAGDNENLLDKTTVVTNKYINNQGEEVAGAGFDASDFISVNPNTNIVLSGNNFIQSTHGAKGAFYNINKEFVSYVNIAIGNNVYAVPKTARYFRFSLKPNDLDIIKVEKGNKATPYSPYGMGSINEKIKNADGTEEQDYSIFVQQPFRSIGDVRDLFFKNVKGSKYYNKDLEENKWYERHYIGEVVLDGTENWNYEGGRFVLNFLISALDISGRQKVYSNYFEYLPSGSADYGIFVYKASSTNSQIYILDKDYTTTAEFKAMLAEKYANGKPVYVDYLLEESLDLPCTETQIQQLENLPSTYKDFTIIQSEDETPAYLEVSGIYDLNKLINN